MTCPQWTPCIWFYFGELESLPQSSGSAKCAKPHSPQSHSTFSTVWSYYPTSTFSSNPPLGEREKFQLFSIGYRFCLLVATRYDQSRAEVYTSGTQVNLIMVHSKWKTTSLSFFSFKIKSKGSSNKIENFYQDLINLLFWQFNLGWGKTYFSFVKMLFIYF